MSYKIPIFLSYPKPYLKKQDDFIDQIKLLLDNKGFLARTLGVTDYDMEEPLTAIRRLMLECNGIITVAFKRTLIVQGITKPNSDNGDAMIQLENMWTTSPYSHIEPAMAFQIGLPVLIIRENGVIADGVLEKGVIGTYLPEFNLEGDIGKYLNSNEWRQILGKWEGYVRKVVDNKGRPPKLY
ncbi:hypothetical protein [Parapedobacter koreensis]|uniref:Nucleoside 2-deoxyribosyltransferase n=1 Tax=Parapedobacter koreensis TaxID=332977 RepID=A0A1H7SEN0_9SPHI|nr:hypothetical protein [Parapedobacter koreensis]SEL70184.1 hypothetical protein SAMN05421740_108218 [Parapedobacter koreensis]